MSNKIRKSIISMLLNIDDFKTLERIHRFVQFLYMKK